MRAYKLLTVTTTLATMIVLAVASAPDEPAIASAVGARPGPQAGPTAIGIVTGLVLGPGGAPRANACVTASGPAGSVSAVTAKDGRYLLSGMRTGLYALRYQDCAHPARYAPRWRAAAGVAAGPALPVGAELPSQAGLPGEAVAPSAGSRIMIIGGHVTHLAPVTLQPARQEGAMRPTAPRRLTTARLRGRAGRASSGRMTGHVTDAAGHALGGFCVTAQYSGFSIGTSTAKDGSYHLGPFLPPGHVTVEFTASCQGGPTGSAGNWAPQWYKNRFSQATADRVTIRAGHTTKGISAVMRHGGRITGVVTNRSGARLSGVCVDILTNDGKTFVAQVKTSGGRYLAGSLDPGRYRVLFDPACGFHRTPYLLRWWRGASTFRASAPVTVRLAATTRNVNATLARGGKIAGVVRLKNRSGRPLRGMCIDASGRRGAVSSVDIFTSTGRRGRYVVEGLPTGSYSLFAGPGCRNNGNVLFQNRQVSVAAGKTDVINFYLQPGAILAGKVTSAADGAPLGGICVGIARLGDLRVTRSDGSYTLDQIPSGRYVISFAGGCGNAGSYAPQWYPGREKFFNAVRVTLTKGKVTSGIDAAMRPGATVTGTVLTASGHKVSDVCVGALDPGTAAAFGDLGNTLSRNGGYRIANLAAGQYQVVFFWCGPGPGYTTQWFKSKPESARASLLDVGRAATVTGIDAVLRPAGGISGTVTDARGNPVQFVCVSVINTKPGGVSSLFQFEFSGYEIGGLPPGRYDVQFTDCGGFGYATQWYSGKTRQRTANPVAVTAGHITKSIDAALLTRAGSITGRVTAKATGRPVPGICAFAFNHSAFGFAITSKSGDYTVKSLNTGSYRMSFFSCRRGGPYASVTRPGLIRVVSPKAVTGINEALVPGASVSGSVVAGPPNPGVQPEVCVDVVTAAGGAIASSAVTGHGGRYVVGNLAAGTYKVFFGDAVCPGGAQGVVPQWYQGKHTKAAATTIVVRTGQALTGVDATLWRDGAITGTVAGPAPASTPLTGVCVIARPLNGAASVYAFTAGGKYALADLPPGRYQVEFQSGCGATGLATQWWDDATSRSAAAVLVVSPGRTTAGIDATMRT